MVRSHGATVRLIDLTLPTPEENLALDEALLRTLDEAAAAGVDPGRWEGLRLWESPLPVVVLGRSGRAEEEVDLAACAEMGVPVRRRASGGGAVVLGPGCLCFALALSYRLHPALRDVARSYRIVLGAVAAALDVEGLAVRGMADLALVDRKVSGNAQLRGRHGLLHQGTLLNGFEPALLPRLLREPRRQPLYRDWRRHLDFVGDLPLPRRVVKSRLLRVRTAMSDEAAAPPSCGP
jgi:lipoate-protein ligase A